MNIPAELRYTSDHEWVRLEGDIATIGITDFAQHELGEISIPLVKNLLLMKFLEPLKRLKQYPTCFCQWQELF